MRILFDESLPHDPAPVIVVNQAGGFQRSTQGLCSVKNGKLLALAALRFDALIVADRNLEFQQNLPRLPLSFAVLTARKDKRS